MTQRRTTSLLLLLLLLYVHQPVHAAIANASVLPASLDAGVVSDVTVSFTAGADVEVGGSVLVELSAGFRIPSTTTVAVLTAGSTTLTVATVSTTQLSVQVGTTQISADAAIEFTIADVANPAAQTTSVFTISTYDSSSALLETNTAVSRVAISKTALVDASVVLGSSKAGELTSAIVTLTSAVGLPVGSLVKVTFPSDFTVSAPALVSADGIDPTSIVTTDSSVVTVEIAVSAVVAGSTVEFVLDGVTNPGAKTTGAFSVATTDFATYIFEDAEEIWPVVIRSTSLVGVSVAVDIPIAGVASSYTVEFTTDVDVPVGGYFVVAVPSDYTLSAAPSFVDSVLSITWAGSINGEALKFQALTSYAAGQHSVQVEFLQNPGASTTGSFTVSTTDANEFLLQTAGCSGVEIVPGSITDAVLTPQLAHPGIASRVDISFTASAGLATDSLLAIYLPAGEYDAAVAVISAAVSSPLGISASASWNSSNSAILVLLTGSTTIQHGATVSLQVTALDMPPSVRAASTAGTIQSWNDKGLQLDDASTLALSAITAVQDLPCSWATETPNPGITSSILVTFKTNGVIPIGGRIALTLPASDFYADSVGNTPSVVFKNPSTALGAASWDDTSKVLEIIISNSAIPAYKADVQLKIAKLDTPVSVRTASRLPASLTTFDPLGIVIDGPSVLQLDAITAGYVSGSRLWTAANAVAGVTSDQTVAFSITGGMDPGGKFELTLPDSQWSMAASSSATFTSPDLGEVGSVVWDTPTRMMTVSLTGTAAIPAYSSVIFTIRDVTNPPKETGINNAFLTIRAADNSIIDGPDTISVMTISRGALTGAKTWTSVTTASATMQSDQLLSFTLSGALPSGSVILVTLPAGGWRFVNAASVDASFSLPATGVTVQSATWFSDLAELRIVTSGSLSETTPVELLIKDMINPYQSSPTGACTVLTMLADSGVVDESKDVVINPITSDPLPTEGSWTSSLATPGVLSTQTVTFTTGGKVEPGARFCVTTMDVWALMASTSAALTLAASAQSSPVALAFDKTTGTLCMQTEVGIDQETQVTIVLTDILSPESVHAERHASLRIQSHLGGDVNTGSVRINAIAAGALTAPLRWQTLVFSPGPVAGLQTSSNLALKTTGQVAAGGYLKVKLPAEWVMAATCEATFVHPSVRGTPSCSQNDISILLLDGLSAAADVDILFSGVYNPPVVMSEGVASAWTIAADGGTVDTSDSVTTGAIVSAVTGVTNPGDHLVAVVGVSKTFVFEGSALAQGDVIKFVDASTTSDANCGAATTGWSDAGGVPVKYLSADDDTTFKFTQSSPDGQPFAICYKFGMNPFKLYPALSVTVKQIKSVTADVGFADIAVANFVKTWRFTGSGVSTGDRVRWIDLDVVDSPAYISTPPDCLDTSALATLASPVAGALTAPEDDHTRVVTAADAAFAFSVDSSGKTFCLCYKFGNEPYVVYPSIKVQVNHLRSIEAAGVGSDSVAVVDAPKSFRFLGDGVFLNDRLYFVEAGSVSSCAESDNDTSLQLTHFLNDQVQRTVFLNADLEAGVRFEAAAAGKIVVPCYQFGMEPHQLYPELWLAVKMVTHYTGTLGSPQLAVADVAEPLTFLGYGLDAGDQVRWILNGEEDCESSLTSLAEPSTLALVDTITLDADKAATFVFTNTQSDYNPVLCYKFGLENFVLYPDISIGIGTIREKATLTGAKDVAVAGSRKNFTLVGTNVAAGDRVGWTAVLNSTVPCANLSLLVPNPRNTDNDYLSYVTGGQAAFGVALASLNSGRRVYLCYGFGREPFKLFPDLYLNVKSITNMRALVASPSVAVAGAVKTFLFDGDGVATGDFAKFVSSDSGDCTAPGVTLLNVMKEFDDYDEMAMFLYEIGSSTTTGSFQVSSDNSSAGLGRVLCYRFGVEAFTYYENFHVDVKTIWALEQVDAGSGGQDGVVVVNEPKHMAIVGVGMSEKDALKFVNASGDSECGDLPARGQRDPKLQVNGDATVWLPFDSGSDGGTWTLCYKFDDEPYRLYAAVAVVVKEVTSLRDYTFQDIDGLGGVATIGHRKQWKVAGSGVQEGDTVKIVPQSVTSSIDCGTGDANLVTGTSVMTVGSAFMFSGILSAYPASTSDVYHLCYKFQDEPFAYVRGFTLTAYGLANLDRDVVLVSATTTAQISGFRISDTDELGWTTSSTSCSTMLGRTEVAGMKASIYFTNSYTRLYLCYSFDRQPFDIFKAVTLAVAKAEIWTPQTVSIIADQTTALDVSGTFGIAQGTDQIAWVPSDVVECSAEAVALYAGVMSTSVSGVERSQSSVPHAGKATFNAKYVAPSSGSGVTATDSFSTWKLCYRFGTTPSFLMFGDVLCSVLNVVQVSLVSLDATSAGAVMKFEFDGVGMQDFDAVKWVDAAAAASDADCSALPAIGGSRTSDVVNSRATFTFVEESPAMALCYKFLGHAFKLYANMPIQDSTKSGASSGQGAAGTITSSYDEEAIAAASDLFVASRDIATISLTLDKDINEIPAGSNAEAAFKAAFISTLATSLGIDASRVQITELVAGSVVVNFQLLASDDPADPSVLEAVQDLHAQLLDTSSSLLASNTIVVKNPATALSVSLATLPAPASSSVAIQALGYQSNGLFSFARSIYSVTETSAKLAIPILRQQGTASVVSITVQVAATRTSAVFDEDYSFPASTTFDESLKLIHLSFAIGQEVQMLELNLLDNAVKGVHFKTLALALLSPLISGAALGSAKETLVRIYDYGDGVSLAKSSFAATHEDDGDQRDLLQGWQVVANGGSPLRVDGNGIFAVDDVVGEAEYNEKCDLAAPTGVCAYACELGGGLPSFDGVETTYNVLSLDADDYVASMAGVSAFPSEALTVSLWVKTTQTDPGACMYSYAASSLTAPAVPLALCNPSSLQLFINAESDVNGLATFVNVSDDAWHFLAITWSSADGRVRVFDNGMLAFDGGPYQGGETIEPNGVFVLGHLVLSKDVVCNVVAGSGFQGQVQHAHVWSRMLGRSELLGELAWPLRVVSNGLVLGWNFDTAFLLLQGRVVNDLSMQGQEQKNVGVLHCSSVLQLTSAAAANTSSSSCLLRGEMPRLDAAFPCGPVFSNVWYFSAPVPFTAKLKSAYGGRLQFRLLAPSFNGAPRPRRHQVSIFGTDADGVATQVSVALGSFDLPSASRWTFYSVVLREDFGWITEPSGASLTAAAFKALLERATALWIRGDMWGYDSTGSGQEVVYLNDVALYSR